MKIDLNLREWIVVSCSLYLMCQGEAYREECLLLMKKISEQLPIDKEEL